MHILSPIAIANAGVLAVMRNIAYFPGVNIDVFSFRYGGVLSDFLAIGEIQQVVVWFQNRWSDHVWLRESVSCYDTY